MDRTFLSTLSVKSIRGLANDVLPPRLAAKLGKGKTDAVETMAEIAEDARNNGGRLDATERRAFTAWAPKEIGGEHYDDITKILGDGTEVEDDDGANIFGSGDDTDKARFAA